MGALVAFLVIINEAFLRIFFSCSFLPIRSESSTRSRPLKTDCYYKIKDFLLMYKNSGLSDIIENFSCPMSNGSR